MAARITFEDGQWTNVFCEGCELTHKVLTAHRRGRWECPYCNASVELYDWKKDPDGLLDQPTLEGQAAEGGK